MGRAILILNTKGFTIKTRLYTDFTPWDHVKEFTIATTSVPTFYGSSVKNRMIGVQMGKEHRTKAHNLSRGLSGADGGLPDTFGLSKEKLLKLLQDYHRQALLSDQNLSSSSKNT